MHFSSSMIICHRMYIKRVVYLIIMVRGFFASSACSIQQTYSVVSQLFRIRDIVGRWEWKDAHQYEAKFTSPSPNFIFQRTYFTRSFYFFAFFQVSFLQQLNPWSTSVSTHDLLILPIILRISDNIDSWVHNTFQEALLWSIVSY